MTPPGSGAKQKCSAIIHLAMNPRSADFLVEELLASLMRTLADIEGRIDTEDKPQDLYFVFRECVARKIVDLIGLAMKDKELTFHLYKMGTHGNYARAKDFESINERFERLQERFKVLAGSVLN